MLCFRESVCSVIITLSVKTSRSVLCFGPPVLLSKINLGKGPKFPQTLLMSPPHHPASSTIFCLVPVGFWLCTSLGCDSSNYSGTTASQVTLSASSNGRQLAAPSLPFSCFFCLVCATGIPAPAKGQALARPHDPLCPTFLPAQCAHSFILFLCFSHPHTQQKPPSVYPHLNDRHHPTQVLNLPFRTIFNTLCSLSSKSPPVSSLFKVILYSGHILGRFLPGQGVSDVPGRPPQGL